MILVHGLGGSHANWLAVGPGLAARARVLAPDLPGFGRTPLAGRSARVRANVELLDRLLDAVDGGPAVLVGNSMGGLIAMMEAAARPEKVAGLVLVGPAQPRPRGALLDPAVALTFAAYAFPGVGERFLRWRAAWLGPERLVRQTLALCCADPASVPPDVVAAHVALARERQRMPWAQPAFLEAARSILAVLARRREVQATIRRITAPRTVWSRSRPPARWQRSGPTGGSRSSSTSATCRSSRRRSGSWRRSPGGWRTRSARPVRRRVDVAADDPRRAPGYGGRRARRAGRGSRPARRRSG